MCPTKVTAAVMSEVKIVIIPGEVKRVIRTGASKVYLEANDQQCYVVNAFIAYEWNMNQN